MASFHVEFLVLAASVFLVAYFYFQQRRPKNYPPGPKGLPFVGSLFTLSSEPSKDFMKMADTYGDVFALRVGPLNMIVLNSASAIREALSESTFSGRPLMEFFPDRTKGKRGGVLFSDGSIWVEQRRFMLKNLRDFGFGKTSMEGLVHEEIKELIETFKQSADAGTPINTTNKFNTAVLNALWSIVSGQRYSHADPVLAELVRGITSTFRGSKFFQITVLYPILRKILPNFLINTGGFSSTKGRAEIQRSTEFIHRSIHAHKETIQENAPRDFIDVYLNKISKTSDPHSSFYESNGNGDKNLLTSLNDLFLAGAETTATTLSWVFLLLALNPQAQEKLYQEIKHVVGTSRLPNLEDKALLPYTEAVIMEVMRIGTILPIALTHRVTETVSFRGYTIPKNTLVLPNIYGVLNDPKVWGDPEVFRPERFLTPDGSKVLRRDEFIPFSVGKRVCLGESLARAELFLFSTSLFQRFEVKPDPNSPPLKIDYHFGPIMSPKAHLLMLRDRLG